MFIEKIKEELDSKRKVLAKLRKEKKDKNKIDKFVGEVRNLKKKLADASDDIKTKNKKDIFNDDFKKRMTERMKLKRQKKKKFGAR